MKMKRYILIAAVVASGLACGCKSEKKINYYSDIYEEKPTTILIAPVIDNAERKVEKYPSDIEYNNAVNTATAYLRATMDSPLLKKGYYVIGPMAGRAVADGVNLSKKEWASGDITMLNKDYGVDAVLVVTLQSWKEGNGTWTACLEYQLRSTKTGHDMMHTWVLATKEVPKNMKGDPVKMKSDAAFAKKHDFDNETAQRAFLVEKVNDYVLRDLPISNSLRQFEKDLYKSANSTYIKYTWSEDGGADVGKCSVEEYEEKAFL